MNNMEKVVAVAGVTVLFGGTLATGVGYMISNNDSPVEKELVKKDLSASEKEDVVNQVVEMTSSGYRPIEVEKELRKHIDQLDKEKSTRMVRELMNSINKTSDYFSQMLNVMGPEMQYSQLVDGLNDLVKDKKKISSHLVTGFMDEIERQHLHVKPRNNSYYIEPDANYVLQKYGTYIHGDYKDYLNIEAKEQTDPIFNSKKQMYNPDRIKEDLETIDNSRDRWSDGTYADDFKQLEIKLYEDMFSVSQATFFDVKIENEGKDNEEFIYTLKDEIRKKYESYILDNSDATLSKELDKFLDVLKANKYQLNDKVDGYLEKMFNKKFGDDLHPITDQRDNKDVSDNGTSKTTKS